MEVLREHGEALCGCQVEVYHLVALVVDPTEPQVGLPTNNNLDYSITSWYVHSWGTS